VIVTYTAGARQAGGAAGGAASRAPVGVDISGPGGYDEPGAVRARELPDAAADAELRRYNDGSLVIDLLDGQTRRLVWRATADLELASDRGGRMIDAVVRRAFAALPLAGQPSPAADAQSEPVPGLATAPAPAPAPASSSATGEPGGTSTTDLSSE
jgi:hypothetical protein